MGENFKNLPKRKSIRLKNWDYSSVGWYFVTICTQNRKCLFGNIVDGKMVSNGIGRMINQWYLKTPEWFKNMTLDEFQIMPNHLHGIIAINNRQIVGVGLPDPSNGCGNHDHGCGNRTPTLGQIVAYFKYQSTKQINILQKTPGKRLWQRNYYEHIIRVRVDPCIDPSLTKIRQYIINNPAMWDRDRNNPKNYN